MCQPTIYFFQLVRKFVKLDGGLQELTFPWRESVFSASVQTYVQTRDAEGDNSQTKDLIGLHFTIILSSDFATVHSSCEHPTILSATVEYITIGEITVKYFWAIKVNEMRNLPRHQQGHPQEYPNHANFVLETQKKVGSGYVYYPEINKEPEVGRYILVTIFSNNTMTIITKVNFRNSAGPGQFG